MSVVCACVSDRGPAMCDVRENRTDGESGTAAQRQHSAVVTLVWAHAQTTYTHLVEGEGGRAELMQKVKVALCRSFTVHLPLLHTQAHRHGDASRTDVHERIVSIETER